MPDIMPEVDHLKAFVILVLAGIAAEIMAYVLDITIMPYLGKVSGGYIPGQV